MANCAHEHWTAKNVEMTDGRPSLREFCVGCGLSNGGSRLGLSVPLIADIDVPVLSYKYQNKTLGEIFNIDKSYLKWLVCESGAPDRVRKSAARIYFNKPYSPPKEGEIYPFRQIYNPMEGAELVRKLKLNL